MRTLLLPFTLVAFIVVGSGAGCGSGVAPISDDGGSSDGAGPDGSGSDGSAVGDSAVGDGAVGDGGGGDGAASCTLLGGTYDKTCGSAGDCSMVARGCYCGSQPVIGVAKSAAPAAQACETTAEDKCALGCPNAPGHVAEDGKNDQTGGTIQVRCDNNKCQTFLQ